MNSVEKAEQILRGIAQEFSYSGEIRAPFLGRTIAEIERTKKFCVNYVCPEESVLAAYRLKQAGFMPEIVLEQKIRFGIKSHVFVVVPIQGILFRIHFGKDFGLHPLRALKSTFRRRYTRIPFALNPNQSFLAAVKKEAPILVLGRVLYPLSSKRWPLVVNRKKDAAKAAERNEKFRIAREKSRHKP